MPSKNRTQPTRNNAAVKHSLKRGRAIGDYIGSNPRFTPGIAGPTKTTKGIPFVRRERAMLDQ